MTSAITAVRPRGSCGGKAVPNEIPTQPGNVTVRRASRLEGQA
jgi:hypothetical protein